MSRTFVIAEAGSCHGGSYSDAERLVREAARAGVDAIKFQYWSSPLRLANRRRVPQHYYEIYKRYQMPAEWLSPLALVAAEAGLELLCTTYLPGDEAAVRPFVKQFKIASFEALDQALLEELQALGPVIVSGGMLAAGEWRQLMSRLRSEDALLHCVSAYPADPAQMQLRVLRDHAAGRVFDCCGAHEWQPRPGLSDHSRQVDMGALAVAAGAQVIEAHLRLDDTDPGNPDFATAFTPAEFTEYVRLIRRAEAIMGAGEKRRQPCEAEMAAYRVLPV